MGSIDFCLFAEELFRGKIGVSFPAYTTSDALPADVVFATIQAFELKFSWRTFRTFIMHLWAFQSVESRAFLDEVRCRFFRVPSLELFPLLLVGQESPFSELAIESAVRPAVQRAVQPAVQPVPPACREA
jgi:hypothetical protein